jgi:hypothetical protein
LTIKELGGWKSLKMVERYAHLSDDHLHAAVERLAGVTPLRSASGQAQRQGLEPASQLRPNYFPVRIGSRTATVFAGCPTRIESECTVIR